MWYNYAMLLYSCVFLNAKIKLFFHTGYKVLNVSLINEL